MSEPLETINKYNQGHFLTLEGIVCHFMLSMCCRYKRLSIIQ